MQQQTRNPLALFGVLFLAFVVAMSMSIGDADAKKKKKKKKKKPTPVTSTVTTTKSVGQPVPDRAGLLATDRWGQLSSTIDVPVTGKAKFVTDVNVTVQTTGSAAGAANDLVARLSAPNGRTQTLFSNLGDATLTSIGPFKMDDDTATMICNAPPCPDPDQNLNPPFAGTAQPQGALGAFDWVPMKGTWTLKLFDTNPTLTSTFTSWTLEVSGRSYPRKK